LNTLLSPFRKHWECEIPGRLDALQGGIFQEFRTGAQNIRHPAREINRAERPRARIKNGYFAAESQKKRNSARRGCGCAMYSLEASNFGKPFLEH
jgi:hypothetical protein